MSDEADRIFLETTRRLAPASLAMQDVRTALSLLRPALGEGGRFADLGCGYGRHLAAIEAEGVRERIKGLRAALGVDRSALLLAEAKKLAPRARLVRADLRALPLRRGALDAAACFYSSMFLGSDEDARAALAEAARVLRPGGRLVLTTDNPLRLAASPRATFSQEVPGLGRLVEESAYDAASGVDTVQRTLQRPGAPSLTARWRIRYYHPLALWTLAEAAGLSQGRLEPDEPLTEETPQLTALFVRAGG